MTVATSRERDDVQDRENQRQAPCDLDRGGAAAGRVSERNRDENHERGGQAHLRNLAQPISVDRSQLVAASKRGDQT